MKESSVPIELILKQRFSHKCYEYTHSYVMYKKGKLLHLKLKIPLVNTKSHTNVTKFTTSQRINVLNENIIGMAVIKVVFINNLCK